MVPGGHYVSVASNDVDSLTGFSQQEFIDDLNAWTRRGYLQVQTVGVTALVVLIAAWLGSPFLLCSALAGLGLLAFSVARVVECRRREYYLLYADLDEEAEVHFDSVGQALVQLSRSGFLANACVEHVHGDRKRHAGATITVQSDPVEIGRGYPRHMSSNLDPAPIRLRAQNKTLCFLPDRLLVEDHGQKAAISYDSLNITCEIINTAWEGAVPHDAKIVGQSWHYVNKNGGPDRRFKNNYVVQIVKVAVLTLQSSTGLEIVLQATATKAAFQAVDALHKLASGNAKGGGQLSAFGTNE
jgi:hypothetical protein